MSTHEDILAALGRQGLPGHRDRKKAEKLRRILDAGRELFAEHGYEGTTTRAISERAGIATGTLFSYFPDKRALLVQLFSLDMGAAVNEAFAALDAGQLAGAPLIDRVMHLFGVCFGYYERDLRLARSVIKEMLFADPASQQVLSAVTGGFITRIAGEVEAAKARGEVRRDVGSAAAASVFFAQYYLALIGWVNGIVPDAGTGKMLLRQSLHLIHRGLAGPEVRAGA